MTQPKFEEEFDSFVCENDSIQAEVDGVVYRAKIVFDTDLHIDDDDSHNVDQAITGCNDKQQAKLIAARKAWFSNEWVYCGVVISAIKAGIVIDRNAASLWGIEANYPGSDNSYLSEVANGLLTEAIEEVTNRIDNMIADLQR